jgi:hypothetical protein
MCNFYFLWGGSFDLSLDGGETEGSDWFLTSFSEVFSTNSRELCVISISYGVICNCLYCHRLLIMWCFQALRGTPRSKKKSWQLSWCHDVDKTPWCRNKNAIYTYVSVVGNVLTIVLTIVPMLSFSLSSFAGNCFFVDKTISYWAIGITSCSNSSSCIKASGPELNENKVGI